MQSASDSGNPKQPAKYISQVAKWGIPALILVGALVLFRQAIAGALAPFIIALVLAYILDPLVASVERGKIPIKRLGSVIVLYLGVLVILVVFVGVVIPTAYVQIEELATDTWTKYVPRATDLVREWVEKGGPSFAWMAREAKKKVGLEEEQDTVPTVPDATSEVAVTAGEVESSTGETTRFQDAFLWLMERVSDKEGRADLAEAVKGGWTVIDFLVASLTRLMLRLVDKVQGFLSSATNLVLALVILFYILLDFSKLKLRLKTLIPERHREQALRILGLIDSQLSAYLRGQVVVCLCVGTLVTVGLFGVGLVFDLSVAKYCLLIGICAGVFNLVPYLGPVMGAMPAIILTVVDVYDPSRGGMWSELALQVSLVVVLFIFVQLADGFLISPRVMGNRLNLHPMIILLALMLGGAIWGFLGMIVAVPVACVIRTVINELYLKGNAEEAGGAGIASS